MASPSIIGEGGSSSFASFSWTLSGGGGIQTMQRLKEPEDGIRKHSSDPFLPLPIYQWQFPQPDDWAASCPNVLPPEKLQFFFPLNHKQKDTALLAVKAEGQSELSQISFSFRPTFKAGRKKKTPNLISLNAKWGVNF